MSSAPIHIAERMANVDDTTGYRAVEGLGKGEIADIVQEWFHAQNVAVEVGRGFHVVDH